jgi:hypothetical protein
MRRQVRRNATCVPLKIEVDSEYKYVNGGFYIGYYKDIMNMWEEMMSCDNNDDQVTKKHSV